MRASQQRCSTAIYDKNSKMINKSQNFISKKIAKFALILLVSSFISDSLFCLFIRFMSLIFCSLIVRFNKKKNKLK